MRFEFMNDVARPDWESAKPIDQAWLKDHSTLGDRLLRRFYEWTDLFH